MFDKLAIAVLKVIGGHCRLYLATFFLQCFLLFSELINLNLAFFLLRLHIIPSFDLYFRHECYPCGDLIARGTFVGKRSVLMQICRVEDVFAR